MNILALLFSVVLASSAIVAALLAVRARAAARDYLRFAAMLFLALASCDAVTAFYSGTLTQDFAQAVMLVVLALAPPASALALFAAFEHPPSAGAATPVLVLACLSGIAAASFGIPALSFALLAASVCVILALALRRWRQDRRGAAYAILAACCLLAGAAASFTGRDLSGLALFSAASLLGFGVAAVPPSRVPVAQKRDLRGEALPVSRGSARVR